MSEIKKTYREVELARVTINEDVLNAWRKPDSDDIPVCSFLSIYEASGLEPIIRKYYEDNESKQIVALDNLACNFYTLQRLKNYIVNVWERYSLSIDGDGHVFWDTSKYPKGKKHYTKKMKAIVRNSVNTDFANFCPGLDDELPDNVIVFRVYEEETINSDESN